METTFLPEHSSSFKIGNIELLNAPEKTTQSESDTSDTTIRISYYKPSLDARGKPIVSHSVTHHSQDSAELIPLSTPSLCASSTTQNKNYPQIIDYKWIPYDIASANKERFSARQKKTYNKNQSPHIQFQGKLYLNLIGKSLLPKTPQSARQAMQETILKSQSENNLRISKLFLQKTESSDEKSNQYKTKSIVNYQYTFPPSSSLHNS